MPRLRNGELSQTKRAIRERELSAANRVAVRELIISNEPIGIKGGRQRPPDADPGDQGDQDEGQVYICLNCQAPVDYGCANCSVCQEQLNWEGL